MFELKTCSHEYHVTYERCRYSFLEFYFVTIFHLSCIHCGKGFCHKEKIRYHGGEAYPSLNVRETFQKAIFTRLYAKFPIVNKLTKL
jgi:hypothetical protein